MTVTMAIPCEVHKQPLMAVTMATLYLFVWGFSCVALYWSACLFLHWYTYYAKFVLSNIQQLLVTRFVYTPPRLCRLTVGVVSRRGYV